MLDREIERMGPKKLRSLHDRRLKRIVRYAYERVPLYRKRCREAKVTPDDLGTPEDLAKFPFTMKDDLRQAYPYGLLAVPRKDIVEFHASSGTTGKPTVVGYTRHDLDTWTRLMARSYACAGAKKGDIVQNAYGYGLFTGGLGFHYGAEALGLAVFPMSAGNTKRQLLFMKDMKTTILAATPSYALYLGEEAGKEGYDPPRDFKIRLGMFGAEPWSEEARRRIEDAFGMRAHDNYGLSELYGPGVAVECPEQDGLHIWADEFYPETIDPKTGDTLEPGEEGELVFTMLTREAMPLIRYRTRDLSSLMVEACACGRSMPRLARLTGRSDDMLIIGGVNVFPSQVEDALLQVEGVGDWYEIVVDRDILDRLHVRVEVEPSFYESGAFDPSILQQTIAEELRSVLTVFARVELLPPGSLPRTEGKAKRVIDLRQPAA
jgi:phenylacetate-CoA ligase